MGKNQHSKDRLFLTATEWRELGGGKKIQIGAGAGGGYRPLPFDACSLSLAPFVTPVCVPEGNVFEVENIITWIKKHHTNPVTGAPLAIKDLIPLVFHKDSAGLYHCPVTFKLFGPHSRIIAIKTTGNVYSHEAIDELCLKPKNYKDLLTDEPFSKKDDLIVLQDPADPSLRDISQFYFMKAKERIGSAPAPTTHISSATKRILDEVEATAVTRAADSARMGMITSAPPASLKHSTEALHTSMRSTGASAAAFTCTDMAVLTRSAPAVETVKDKLQLKYDRSRALGKKGYVQLMTNLGNLNVELHCELVPKTCDNFMTLCQRGYYNGVLFHRSIPNFMIQGGDPTGTGRGGESCFGGKFEDEFHRTLSHDGRGILAMANSGPGTNGSQFYITFKDCKHLDKKHTVFGRVVGGLSVLRQMEYVETAKGDKPKDDITITSTVVFTNPIAEAEAELQAEADAVAAAAQAEVERKEALLEQARTAGAREAMAADTSVGKYMSKPAPKRPRETALALASAGAGAYPGED